MRRFFELIKIFYQRFFLTPEKQARLDGVTIGEQCFIDTRDFGTEPYLVKIGSNVAITHGVAIHTHGGGRVVRMKHPDFDMFGKVIVEDWAYIGAFSQIMPGVTIGEGALVAAGSIVTKSVAPHTVVGGNPAKYICTTEEFYEKNKKYNLSTKGLCAKEKKELLLHLSDEMFLKK